MNPQTLARYQIQGEIGRGMMGVVYRALDPALGRIVALKTVQPAFPLPEEQRKAFEERFLSEARVAAGLSHPAIVVVHDVGRDVESGALFIAFGVGALAAIVAWTRMPALPRPGDAGPAAAD